MKKNTDENVYAKNSNNNQNNISVKNKFSEEEKDGINQNLFVNHNKNEENYYKVGAYEKKINPNNSISNINDLSHGIENHNSNIQENSNFNNYNNSLYNIKKDDIVKKDIRYMRGKYYLIKKDFFT